MRHHTLSRFLSVFVGVMSLLLLSGCGTYYTVSVDSLRDDAQPDKGSYFLEPGDEAVRPDDLLFREAAQQIGQALVMQGKRVVDKRSEAQNIARISYWEGTPETRVDYGTRTTSVPVTTRHHGKYHTEYVYVEEPTVTTYTVYSAGMLIEAYTLAKDKETPLWRTSVRCSGPEDDFRGLLAIMTPVLSSQLGEQTMGTRRFEVFVEDNGKISVSAMD